MYVREYFRDCLHFEDEEVAKRVSDVSKIVALSRGEKLIEMGEVQKYIPVIIKGILRGYVIDAGGRDITDCFAYCYGDIAVGCNAPDRPSSITIEAVVDSELLMIPLPVVIELMESFPILRFFYIDQLYRALERHWEGKMLMLRYSAMERYQWFLVKYPGLVDTISNKHIASFLGMTPVTLSRLRRQLKVMAEK